MRLLVLACALTGLAAGAPERFQGLPLAGALGQLQQRGLRVIFSSELVRPDMIVAEEPESRDPQSILDQLLAPHGLRSARGPSGARLVVAAPPTGWIAGTVHLAGEREALRDVHIAAVGTRAATRSDRGGRFAFGPLAAGAYTVELTRPGCRTRRLADVPVTAGAVTELRLQLDPEQIVVQEMVVVRGSHHASQTSPPEVRTAIDPATSVPSPELASDPLLPVRRLPGVAVADGAGALNVRGGTSHEVKIVLDGLELYEPFHLKERGGPISIIDARTIGGIGLLGGAFPAEYGGHMSAVVELESLIPEGAPVTSLAASSGDARVESQGRLGERLHWLVSARRGDPSQLLDALGADPSYEPSYWDLFGKIGYRWGDRTTLALNVLGGDDVLADDAPVPTVDEPGTFSALHANRYAWLTLGRAWSSRLFSKSVLSLGHLTSERSGSSSRIAAVHNARATDLWGLKHDWLFESGRQLFKSGVEIKRLRATYAYSSTPIAAAAEPITIARAPEGDDLGIYVSDQIRLSPDLTVELGLRWDLQTYVPDRDGALSPRLNAAYAIGRRSALRLGWGYFYQPQRIHELQVEDGVADFLPAERAEHRLVAFDHELRGGLELQVQAYQKLMHELNPRFENLFDPFGLFPEAEGDRVRIAPDAARAYGLDLAVRGQASPRTRWWASSSLARAEDRIEGRWVPRGWDQRHALAAGLQWTPGERWGLALAGSHHSGRPTTPVTATTTTLSDGSTAIVPVIGARNSRRLPSYQRVDFRLSRSVPLRGTDLQTHLTVTNALDRDNACCVADFEFTPAADGSVLAEPRMRHGLPRLVTLGIEWRF